MIKRALAVVVLVAAYSLITVGPVSAQWGASLSANAVMPTGDFGDFADTGWGVNGTVGPSVNENLSVLGIGSYGSVSHADSDDKTNLIGLGGLVVYRLSDPSGVYPFVLGGGGILGHQYSPGVGDSETEWQGFAQGGGGIGFPLGGVRGFVLGSYTHGFDETTYFGLGGGILIPLGGM